MTDYDALAGILVGLGVFLIFIVLIALVVGIVCLIGNWKFYTKCGVEGWKAIIPFYNTWVLVEIAGLNWYWFLLVLAQSIFSIITAVIPALAGLSFIAFIIMIIGNIGLFLNLSKKLHKDTGWVVCGVLFGSIVTAIAGYSKNTTYDAAVEVPKDGIFEKYVNKNNSNN